MFGYERVNRNVLSHCLKTSSDCRYITVRVALGLRLTFHVIPVRTPRVGSGVVRIDPLCFLAGCRKGD